MANSKNIYRPNVAAIVVSSAYPKRIEILVAERSDMPGVWQFPQGGIDEGEKPKEALFRELLEEIGTDKVEVIAKYPNWISYDFPAHVAHNMKPFSGQRQRYFLVRLKKKAIIDLNAYKHQEFTQYRFASLDEVMGLVSDFKRPVYEEAVAYFKKKGHL